MEGLPSRLEFVRRVVAAVPRFTETERALANAVDDLCLEMMKLISALNSAHEEIRELKAKIIANPEKK